MNSLLFLLALPLLYWQGGVESAPALREAGVERLCVPPDMAPLRALELMRQFGVGALPVVSDGQLVGLITEHDFFNVAGLLLLEQLAT